LPAQDEVQPLTEGDVGGGEFPLEFARVNWGAVFLAPIWAIRYGLRPWIGYFLALIIGEIVIDNVALLIDAVTLFPKVMRITSAVTIPAVILGAYVFGVVANQQIWRSHAVRLGSVGKKTRKPIELERFRKSIRFWGVVAIVLAVLDAVGLVAAAFRPDPPSWRSIAGGVIFLGVFAYDRVLIRRGQANKGIEQSARR
jgi:hypothetical protein